MINGGIKKVNSILSYNPHLIFCISRWWRCVLQNIFSTVKMHKKKFILFVSSQMIRFPQQKMSQFFVEE
jgi:hypothetical protein